MRKNRFIVSECLAPTSIVVSYTVLLASASGNMPPMVQALRTRFVRPVLAFDRQAFTGDRQVESNFYISLLLRGAIEPSNLVACCCAYYIDFLVIAPRATASRTVKWLETRPNPAVEA